MVCILLNALLGKEATIVGGMDCLYRNHLGALMQYINENSNITIILINSLCFISVHLNSIKNCKKLEEVDTNSPYGLANPSADSTSSK